MYHHHTITVDQQFLETLRDSNIFQNRYSANREQSYINRYKVEDTIICPIHTCIEEFSTFAHGNQLYSAGSFSSLVSTLPQGSRTGRYTSLARGLKPLGYRHPVEATSTSTAVYHFDREYFAAYREYYEKTNDVTLNLKRVPTPQPQRGPIYIGHDVWIGANATITGGVTIGNGAIIAGNSVVTKDVEPYSLVAGLPARHRKYRFPEEIIQGLEEIHWWDYELGDIYREGLDFSNPEKFINDFIKVKDNLSLLSSRRFFPYLYNYGIDITAKNIIADYHGNLLFFDKESHKIIKSMKFEEELLPIQLGFYKNIAFLEVKDLGYLNIDTDLNIKLSSNLYDVNYTLNYDPLEHTFHITLDNRFLSSQKPGFKWQRRLLTWETFFSFL